MENFLITSHLKTTLRKRKHAEFSNNLFLELNTSESYRKGIGLLLTLPIALMAMFLFSLPELMVMVFLYMTL